MGNKMKLNNALALPLVFCVTALALVVGCSRFNPVSIPNPIPAPQTVLSSGVAGTWLGNVLTPSSYGGCSANPAIVPVTDTLSDDSSTLQLTTISTCGLYIFSSAVTVNPSSYYPKGHLQFDILLGNPPANYSSISIQYLYSNGSNATCNLSANLINSLSTTAFTRVSIPFTSFTGNYYITNVDTPFYVLWQTSVTGSSITLDNIVWTSN